VLAFLLGFALGAALVLLAIETGMLLKERGYRDGDE